MKVLVRFRFTHGSDEETFIIETANTPVDQYQQHLLDAVKAALKDKDKFGTFSLPVTQEFAKGGIMSRGHKSEAHVTIWYE